MIMWYTYAINVARKWSCQIAPLNEITRRRGKMKSDIEIALEAELQPIQEVAKKLDIQEEDLDLYGK